MSLTGFNHTVRWNEFSQRRTRPAGEDEDAFIKVRYRYIYSSTRNGNALTITAATVTIGMQTNESWSVTSQQTADLLRHEQGHYDITAIGAKEFYNNVIGLSAGSDHDLQQAASDLNDEYQQKINTANEQYDAQTDHSNNTQQQQQWLRAIAAEKQKPDGSVNNLP